MGEMDLITNAGSGLGGSLLGALASLMGMKSRLDKIEERITDKIMTRDACLECRTMCRANNETKLSAIAERLRNMERMHERIEKKLDQLLNRGLDDGR